MLESEETLPEAVDLSRHLSALARARTPSPLKNLQRYMNKPGLISMAGGTPNPMYFPFHTLSAEVLEKDAYPLELPAQSSSFSWFWRLFGSKSAERTTSFTIPKYPLKPDDINLAVSLQYSLATGMPQLSKVIREFTEKVYRPAYSNFQTLVHTGNTDGWGKCVFTLCNPGDGVLCSEWTYPSAMAGLRPYGVTPVPVGMDSQGMSSIDLRRVLFEWDPAANGGMARPHIIYTVPVGQNPTGATMGAIRKKEIYAICVEYDVVIVEDDPYYFLQQAAYVPKSERVKEAQVSGDETDFVASLAPSFLRFDYQGRVIRLDTFSKTVAPGSRLGWFTCNPMFAERLERQSEVSSQMPCGFGQAMVASLLLKWQYPGYVRWLRALHLQYQQRRDFMIDCLWDAFDLHASVATEGVQSGTVVYSARLKTLKGSLNEKGGVSTRGTVFSFVPPTSGMFLWFKLHLDAHPAVATVGYKQLELKLWMALLDADVMFSPGQMFSADEVVDETPGAGHFRVSFSMTDEKETKKAVEIFAAIMREFFTEF
ncbi:PLP-dependent transferase [Fistulina hepatica ATCC 64428]|uniref:PLP-dependent transferase n=1 Tax=Fistulina hepatica ATCC 64428 TaxID=1128425 RepID=A0A0D6ZZE1_9AGAR|nr:PLP-dependent transferase [Fistulina hepatica ATCC 64428]